MPSSPTSTGDSVKEQQLVEAVACPHCWHRFPPEDLRFIATSAAFSFDHRLGGGRMRRFLPKDSPVDGTSAPVFRPMSDA